jgi:hypothetical protein
MFFRKKKLYEMDPKTLPMETLLLLQSSLLAKLVLVTKEMQRRYNTLAELSEPVDVDGKNTAYFATEAKRMNGICLIIDNVLAQQIGMAPTGNPN